MKIKNIEETTNQVSFREGGFLRCYPESLPKLIPENAWRRPDKARSSVECFSTWSWLCKPWKQGKVKVEENGWSEKNGLFHLLIPGNPLYGSSMIILKTSHFVWSTGLPGYVCLVYWDPSNLTSNGTSKGTWRIIQVKQKLQHTQTEQSLWHPPIACSRSVSGSCSKGVLKTTLEDHPGTWIRG